MAIESVKVMLNFVFNLVCVRAGNRCKKVTREGTQCKHRPIKWSEFCVLHQTKEKLWFSFITLLIGLGLGYFFFHKSQIVDYQLVNIETVRTIPLVIEFPSLIASSPANLVVTGPDYHEGKSPNCPFSFLIRESGEVLLWGSIRNESGDVAAIAEGSVVRAVPSIGYDINSDERAIEVVDNENRPVLQLRVVSYEHWQKQVDDAMKDIPQIGKYRASIDRQIENFKDVVQLNYVSREGKSWQVKTSGMYRARIDAKDLDDIRAKIIRIFEYPGYKYPGKRVSEKN